MVIKIMVGSLDKNVCRLTHGKNYDSWNDTPAKKKYNCQNDKLVRKSNNWNDMSAKKNW